MTFGQIRRQVTQALKAAGLHAHPDLIDDTANQRYTQILDALAWRRQKKAHTITLVADQADYQMPADCRIVESASSAEFGPLDDVSRIELRRYVSMSGRPRKFARALEDDSDPPRMIVTVYPTPDAASAGEEIDVVYYAELATLAATDTAVSIRPWVRPAALVAGILADLYAYFEKLQMAQFQEGKFAAGLAQINRNELQNEPVKHMRMPARFTAHRAMRAIGRRRLLD